MSLSINNNNINIQFKGRLSKNNKLNMDKVLTVLLENENVDYDSVMKSGCSKNFILGWFKTKFGMTPKEYFRQRQNIVSDVDLSDLYSQDFSAYSLQLQNNSSLKANNFKNNKLKFSKERMDRILLPMVNDNIGDLKLMFTRSGYTKSAVCKWFYKTFGISIAKYIKLLKKNELKREMEDFYERNIPVQDVAEHYGRSINWVYSRYDEFGLKMKNDYMDKKEQEKAIELVKAGYVVKHIADIIKRSPKIIQRLINEHFKEGLVKFRHDNRIPIKHRKNNDELEKVEKIKKFFAEGKSIKETAKLVGESAQRIFYLKEKYNIKTQSDIAHERMETLLPKFVEMKMRLKAMAKEIGLSVQTVRRRIIELYGKNYIDIRMGK